MRLVMVPPRVINHADGEGTASVISRGVLSKSGEIRAALRQSTADLQHSLVGTGYCTGAGELRTGQEEKNGKQGDVGGITSQLLCLLHPCHLMLPHIPSCEVPPRDWQKGSYLERGQ